MAPVRNPGVYRTNANIRGNQPATQVDEVVTAIINNEVSLKSYTMVLKDALTEEQLKTIFSRAPVVTGTKVITASGCAGWAALDSSEKSVLTAKGYTLN